MGRDRNESGRYNDRIDPATVLDVFDERDDQSRPLTAGDVVDALGIARRTAHNKLNALVERGALETRKVGARGRVWWTPTPTGDVDQDGARDGTQDAESGPGTQADRSDPSVDAPDTRQDTAPEDSLDAALADLDTTADRREAVRACVEYLREHGTGQKSEFVDAVYSDHPAGFGSPGGWWNKIGKEHLQTVAEAYPPLTPPATEGGHKWRYVAQGDA